MKHLFKVRLTRVVALVGVCALGLITTALADGKQDFTLHNSTGLVLTKLFISAHEKDEWEEDVLGVEVLGDGEEVTIHFDPKEEADQWDMKVEDDKGKEHVWNNLDLTNITDITLDFNEDGTAIAHIKRLP